MAFLFGLSGADFFYMRKFTIEVTQEDIDKGEGYHCTRCPIALALCRATGWRWLVRRKIAVSNDGHCCNTYNLPEAVQAFIVKFDSSGKFNLGKPFTFELELM